MAIRTGRRWVMLMLAVVLLIGGTYSAQQGSVGQNGRTNTQLSDGRWLLLGGTRTEAYVGLLNPATNSVAALTSRMVVPRSGHTATVLSDGSVLILGGVDAAGRLVTTAERFDPGTETFQVVSSDGLMPRAWHTATLLTDGRLLVAGGIGANGQTLDSADLWDPVLGGSPVNAMRTPRRGGAAELLPDGTVLVSG
ncbi:MAG TPA: kelch repeat-containing protein, partial [Vicinamibacterales bacterium]|nr:kelch repeat-containing protein [Vicinamibacterales bacterium]